MMLTVDALVFNLFNDTFLKLFVHLFTLKISFVSGTAQLTPKRHARHMLKEGTFPVMIAEEIVSAVICTCYVVVNGFQGVKYSSVQTERNAFFKPKVAAVIQLILKRGVSYLEIGRAPVEVVFETPDVAEEFWKEGTRLAKMKKEGASHFYFYSCLTLSSWD